jgi:hypothetical protein
MNAVENLLTELSSLDVKLTPKGNYIDIDAPEGVLKPDLVGRIRGLKLDLLEALHPHNKTWSAKDRHDRHDRHHRPDNHEDTPLPLAWDADMALLIDWFIEDGQHRIPAEPFRLCPWIAVTNPARFRESLLFDISLGPDFITNRNGKLQEDLYHLRDVLSDRNEDRPQ